MVSEWAKRYQRYLRCNCWFLSNIIEQVVACSLNSSIPSAFFLGSWVKERAQFWPHLASLMNSLQSKPEVNQLTAAQISKLKNFPLKDGKETEGGLSSVLLENQ